MITTAGAVTLGILVFVVIVTVYIIIDAHRTDEDWWDHD